VIQPNRNWVRCPSLLRRRRERPRAKRAADRSQRVICAQNRLDRRTARAQTTCPTGRTRRFFGKVVVSESLFVRRRVGHAKPASAPTNLAKPAYSPRQIFFPRPSINSRKHRRPPIARGTNSLRQQRRNPARVRVSCVVKEISAHRRPHCAEFKKTRFHQLAGPDFFTTSLIPCRAPGPKSAGNHS